MGKLRNATGKAVEFYKDLTEKRYSTLAGTLVFFLLMSVVPFAFLLALILSWFHLDASLILDIPGLERYAAATEFLKQAAETASKGATVFLFLTAFYSSANLFYQMRRSGEIIYGEPRPRRGIAVRVSAFVMLAIIFVLFAALIGAVTLGRAVAVALLPGALAQLAFYASLAAVGFVLLFIVNLYIAPERADPAGAAAGGAFTLLFWIAATAVFNVYLGFAHYERLYGALAFAMVTLFWLYILMIGLTVGFVVCERVAKRRKIRKNRTKKVASSSSVVYNDEVH